MKIVQKFIFSMWKFPKIQIFEVKIVKKIDIFQMKNLGRENSKAEMLKNYFKGLSFSKNVLFKKKSKLVRGFGNFYQGLD